jgi:hypothetical protein
LLACLPAHLPACLFVYSAAGGTVIQIGACDDKFTAADTAKLSATAYTGAATYSFIEAVEKYGPQQSYASLLSNMTTTLRWGLVFELPALVASRYGGCCSRTGQGAVNFQCSHM